MAIAFARARYLSRATGGSATRSAAYNARIAVHDERTGESFSFAHRDAPDHHAMLLPEGADPRLADPVALWNMAEKAERRRDAQVARELVIALPANAELTHEDRVALVESFAREHFVSQGLAVQLDIHSPHDGDQDSEAANIHAHLLITTRRVEGDRLSAKKARDLDPQVRQFGNRPGVTEGEAWGQLWRDHQNAYFEAQGLSIRVDATDAVPQEHVGPIRMRAPDSTAVARAEEIAKANALAARDPEKVLAALTRNNATFAERDVDRHLARHIHDEAEHLAVKAKVLGSAETLALHDPDSGDAIGRFTTRTVREEERAAIADAEQVARGRHKDLRAAALDTGLRGRTLRPDQQAAFDHATARGGLKIIEGRAGTGKSFTLQAVRDAHAAAGYRAIGLAPTNSVAQDLKADGFAHTQTVHAELFALKNGRARWDRNTLVVVDEAAMLDTRVMGSLLAEARTSGAKLILAGDDRQLASIERGGLFAQLRERRHGSAEITEVTRQRIDWQRQAARDMAEGRVDSALGAFARARALHWSGTQDEARKALVDRWAGDTIAHPNKSRFVFAYTNADVDALNADLRGVRKARGELGKGVMLDTRHGRAEFAVGDRVQFTDTAKRDGIHNGAVATISAIDSDGQITAALDRPVGERSAVSWSADTFDGFRHGYAGTIYKGQGKTLDQTYLYHSHHWRQAASYVALTRQRESAHIFAATETAPNLGVLARQMRRHEVRDASLTWATLADLPPALRQRAEASAPAQTARTSARPAAERRAEAGRPSAWLIAPRAMPERSGDPGERRAAVAADPAVRRERRMLDEYLAGTYRDPRRAAATLRELIVRDGDTSAARRIEADPAALGELRGGTGLFASAAARAERARAQRVAGSIAPAVRRIGESEARAADRWQQEQDRERAAAQVGVPALSKEAERAVTRLASVPDAKARAELWRGLSDKPVARELGAFVKAVEGRFGKETVRAMERGGKVEPNGLDAKERKAFDKATSVVRTVRPVAREAAGEAQRQVASARLGKGRSLKP